MIESFFDELEKIASTEKAMKLILGTILNYLRIHGGKDKEKKAAMGVDLRMTGPAGIKRPPFPTEGSKSMALKQFKTSRAVGQVKTPKPDIRSVTTMV